MSKLKKTLAALTSLSVIFSTLPAMQSDAIFRDEQGVLHDLHSIPDGCEEFVNTDLYKHHQAYFAAGGPYVFRSKEDSGLFFAFPDIAFSTLMIEVNQKETSWTTIYQKYKENINFEKIDFINDEDTIGVNKVRFTNSLGVGKYIYEKIWDKMDYSAEVDFSESIANVEKEYDITTKKYAIIMDMVTQMKNAGCIKSAHYTAFSNGGPPVVMRTQYIYVHNYAGSMEELEAMVNEISKGTAVSIYEGFNEELTDGEAQTAEDTRPVVYQIEFFQQEDSHSDVAEDYFAVYDMLKGREAELGIEVHIPPAVVGQDRMAPRSVPTFHSKDIDCFALIDSLGDVNIDGRVGIQDIIAMHKSVSEIITLNSDQAMAADMNFDDKVDGKDLDMILRKVVEL